jgi:hypothetical protein
VVGEPQHRIEAPGRERVVERRPPVAIHAHLVRAEAEMVEHDSELRDHDGELLEQAELVASYVEE